MANTRCTVKQMSSTFLSDDDNAMSGQRIYVQPGCAAPETLVDSQTTVVPEQEDVEVRHLSHR